MEESELEAVVHRARLGDAEAFTELYQRFARRVFGLCRHMLGSTEAAEDAASEVFLRLQGSMERYDASLPFPRWLLSVASHHCVDLLRRRRIESRLFVPEALEGDAQNAPTGRSPLSEALAMERREQLTAAIERLPDRYRAALVMRYYGEMSYDEIAAQTGLKRNHVATLIFRGKQELRRILGA
ncbi:MAG TPA: sigma-70 family RNA polymerase sigma factor [Methylomirabilota bacterium]|nr:sigma-70 family RNA polymerase sigma factor [Methylomirabilota bacterium]